MLTEEINFLRREQKVIHTQQRKLERAAYQLGPKSRSLFNAAGLIQQQENNGQDPQKGFSPVPPSSSKGLTRESRYTASDPYKEIEMQRQEIEKLEAQLKSLYEKLNID